MASTIVYAVDNLKAYDHKFYNLEVLSVVEELKPKDRNMVSIVGQYAGAAGHVLLTYPSGGRILTSMGHWVQLMKLDTSAEKLFDYVKKEYGQERVDQMRA